MCKETDPIDTKNDLEEQAQDYEVVVNDNDDASPKRKKGWLLTALCLAVVAAVAIAVAVTQTKDNDSSSSSTASRGGIETEKSGTDGTEATATTTTTTMTTLSPTLAPTMFTPLPTVAPTTAEPTISLAPSTSTPPTNKPTSAPSQSFAPSSNDLETLKLALGLDDSFSAAALEWMVEHGDVDLEDPVRIGQRYALLALDTQLHQTNEPTIVLDADDECQWKGVVCTNDTVTELVWIDDGLVGSIPSEISRLRNLTKLDWAENQLQGELPWQLFELTNLQYLFMHRNQLEGTLSEEFSQLFNLEYLYLGDNRFTGHFPRGLGSPSVGKFYVRPLRTYPGATVSNKIRRSLFSHTLFLH